MLTLNQIISQITTLAGAHSQIASSGVGDFAEWQAEERSYPILWVFHEETLLNERYLTHNIRLICADRVIAGEEGEDTDGHEQEVLSDTQRVLLDFLAYFNNQYGQTYDILRNATIEPFTERFNDRLAGNSVVIGIRQTFEWDKCSIPQSGATIPPTVDGLTLYDFSNPSVFARLTAQQLTDLETLLCTCEDVTIEVNGTEVDTAATGTTYDLVIEDSAGNPVGTSDNPSVIGDSTITINGSSLGATGSVVAEGSLDIDVVQGGVPVGSWNGAEWEVPVIPCDDATVTINGVTMTTIASGDTENIEVRQSSGATLVGSKQGQYWRIADSDISINGTLIDSVQAEDPLDIDVLQGGSPVGSWNGSAWIIPPLTPCPSISLAVSDVAPDFGDVITLTATQTDFTGTITYFFIVRDNLGNWQKIQQSGNVYNYTVAYGGTYMVHVIAEDTDGNSASSCVSITASTLEAKYSITAAYEDEVELVSDKVNVWNDKVGSADATAPSATTRCYTTKWGGSAKCVGVSSENDDRLVTTLNINTSEVTIAFAFDYNDNTVQGAFDALGIVTGDTNISTSRFNLLTVDDSISPRTVNWQVRTSSANTITTPLTNGKVVGVVKYSAGSMRTVINGTTQTLSTSGSLVGSGTINYALLNFNTGSWAGPCPFPVYYIGIKTSALSDAEQDQLYADLLVKYPA